MKKIVEAIQMLSKQDTNLCVDRDKVGETLGHNPAYLLDTYGITKADLIRLERLGLAFKARYEVRHPKADLWDKLDVKIKEANPLLPPMPRVCGTHRVRWVLFKPEVA